MTTDKAIDKYTFIKTLNTFLSVAERTVEDFIDYDCEMNILTREQFNALLKLSSAIKDADLALIQYNKGDDLTVNTGTMCR